MMLKPVRNFQRTPREGTLRGQPNCALSHLGESATLNIQIPYRIAKNNADRYQPCS